MRAFLYCLMGIAHLLAALAFAFVAMDNTGAALGFGFIASMAVTAALVLLMEVLS